MPALLSLKSTIVSHLSSHTKHKITHIFNKTKLVANTEVTQTGRCFASKDLWYEKGRKEGPYLVTFFQGGPSFEIHVTIRQKLRVTILVFTTAPGGKELQAMFGTTGQTGYLLLLCSVSKGKKHSQHSVHRGGNTSKHKSFLSQNQAVGCLVYPLSLKVNLLPQKEAGGHIKL